MRIVIMGSGRTGSLLAGQLANAGHEITIIDWSPDSLARLPEDFVGQTVVGNAVDQDVLREAGLDEADAFVATTSGDNRNIMAGQIAKEVFEVPRVISRIKDPIRAEIFGELGIMVDCRTITGTEVLLDLIEGEGTE